MSGAGPLRITRRSLLRAAGTGAVGLAAARLGGPTAAHAMPGTRGQVAGLRSRSAAGWTTVPRSAFQPPARRDHSLTADPDAGRLYVFGGRAGGDALGDLWSFDAPTGQWNEVLVDGPRPDPRFGHTAIYDAVGRQLVVALGQAGGTFFDDVWAFDPASSAWSSLGASSARRPAARYGAAGAYDPAGRLVISHGFTAQGRFDDTWLLDLTTAAWERLTTIGAVPVKRCLVRATWDPAGPRLLLFGGQTDDAAFLGDFWSLDVGRGSWTEKGTGARPGPRNLYGAAGGGQRWYLVGGNTPDGPAADTWVYDTARDVWAPVETAGGPPARSGLDVATLGDALYLFGGADGAAELGDTWRLPLER